MFERRHHHHLLLVYLVFLLVALFSFARADISTHCLHDQILGKWTFYSTPVMIPDQRALEERVFIWCNKTAEESPFMAKNGHFSIETKIKLSAPNKAFLLDSETEKTVAQGNWTMIYDQGFEVTIDGKKFFAFNDFEVSEDGTYVKSYCDRTQKGWYHDVDGHSNYGCFFGKKMKSKKGDVQVTLVVNKALNSLDKKYKNEQEIVDIINKQQKNWIAKRYKENERLTFEQLQRRAGSLRKKVPKQEFDNYEPFSDSLLAGNAEAKLKRKSYKGEQIDLPENWDWRNVSGVNYVPAPKNQLGCGSCYVFATVAALEARVRIKTQNKVDVKLAPQDIVSCSLYSQLCHGGFPYLASKYVQDFYIVPEDCFPYEGTAVPCEKKCKNPKYRVRASDYYYIGGFYGGSNEIDMMTEIYKHGPIAISYLVQSDFTYYSKGIYHHIEGIAGKKVKGKKVNPWEPVTHSVAIVGWGVEPETKEKYWIVLNSWGEAWGEGGFFRIRRGVDECSVESEAIAVHPEIEFLEPKESN